MSHPIGVPPRLLARICDKVGVRQYGIKTMPAAAEIVDAIREGGPMSLRKIESVLGKPYASLQAAINSPSGRRLIRRVPGTSAPVLYELVKSAHSEFSTNEC